MLLKANIQKKSLLKNAQSNAEGILFKRVFFSPPEKKIPPLFKKRNLFFPTHGLCVSTNSCSSNVNRFEQSVSKLDSTYLRTDRRATDDKAFKEMAGDVLDQTIVLLIK